MESLKDSIQTTCAPPFISSQTNDLQPETTHTVTVPDRAARKEIERQRLRKLLNQGKKKKKKRRRLNASDKLPISPAIGSVTAPFYHCHGRETDLNPPAMPICARVPRKSRSVGIRRRSKSWRSIGDNLRVQPTDVERASSLSVQDEIEFEIAEVLYGLQKQVSSSDLDKASSSHSVVVSKPENRDEDMIKKEASAAKERSPLCSNLSSNGGNATSTVISAPMEEAESKQPEKFVIDLNEPPPVESSLEGEGLERLTADPNVVQKPVMEEAAAAAARRSVKVKDESRDLDLGSMDDDIKDGSQQQFQKRQKAYSGPLHQIHMPFRSGHMMTGPLFFPLNQNQNQTLASNQSGLSVSASPTGNMRFSYPIGASFLSVSPGNVCTNPSYGSKRMHYGGGRNAQPMHFFDGQSHPSQILLPIHVQQQKQFPLTQTNSSVADIRTSSSQRNVTLQSPYPLHPPNVVASMPSGASGGGSGQWRHAEKHELKSEDLRSSTPSFSFAPSTQSSSMDAAAAGLALSFSMAQNPVVAPGFMDKPNLGSHILPADRRLQYRSSAGGNSPAFLGQSGFLLKPCSTVSPASMGAKVFDTSAKTPNCKLAFAKQNALSARLHLSNSNPLGASRDKPTPVRLQSQQQQMSHLMAASQRNVVPTVDNHQPAVAAAKLSTDFSMFSGNLFDKPSHSLRQ